MCENKKPLVSLLLLTWATSSICIIISILPLPSITSKSRLAPCDSILWRFDHVRKQKALVYFQREQHPALCHYLRPVNETNKRKGMPLSYENISRHRDQGYGSVKFHCAWGDRRGGDFRSGHLSKLPGGIWHLIWSCPISIDSLADTFIKSWQWVMWGRRLSSIRNQEYFSDEGINNIYRYVSSTDVITTWTEALSNVKLILT